MVWAKDHASNPISHRGKISGKLLLTRYGSHPVPHFSIGHPAGIGGCHEQWASECLLHSGCNLPKLARLKQETKLPTTIIFSMALFSYFILSSVMMSCFLEKKSLPKCARHIRYLLVLPPCCACCSNHTNWSALKILIPKRPGAEQIKRVCEWVHYSTWSCCV